MSLNSAKLPENRPPPKIPEAQHSTLISISLFLHPVKMGPFKSVKSSSNRKSSRKSATSKLSSSLPPPVTPPSKHLSYFLSIMAETRISNYFTVAGDATALFQSSSESICDCIGAWKTPSEDPDDFDALLELVPESERLSAFGGKVLQIGELLGSLQSQDPIAFLANVQTDAILGPVIPLAKDVVKLKRKLMRMSDAVMEDLKELQKLAEIHGLLAHEEMEVDVLEDFGNYDGSVTDSAMEMLTQRPSVEIRPVKGGCIRLIHIFQNIFTSSKPTATQTAPPGEEEPKKSSKFESKSGPSPLPQPEVKPPSVRSSEKIIQKIVSTLASGPPTGSTDYVLDPVPVQEPNQGSPEEDANLWQSMEDEAQNLLGDTPKPALHYSLQRLESPLVVESLNDAEFKSILYTEAKKYLPRSGEITPNFQSDPNNEVIRDNPETSPENKLDQNHTSAQKTLDCIGINFSDLDSNPGALTQFLAQDHTAFAPRTCPNKTKHVLGQYHALLEGMQVTVSSALERIRLVEKSWMSTNTKALGYPNCLKVGDMLDYIRGTIVLLSDSQFSGQVLPETRGNILRALDPVYREFHSCFIVLGELAESVATDAVYLKELLENLPKGDPIVYEFSSNPSLGSFDQLENSGDETFTPIVLDVDAIFA